MNHQPQGNSTLLPFAALNWLSDSTISPAAEQIQDATQCLADIAHAAREAGLAEIAAGVELLAALMNVLTFRDESSPPDHTQELLGDLRHCLQDVQHLLDDEPEAHQQFLRHTDALRERWGEYLELLQSIASENDSAQWQGSFDENLSDAVDADLSASWSANAAAEQLSLLLSAVAAENQLVAAEEPKAVVQRRVSIASSNSGRSVAEPTSCPVSAEDVSAQNGATLDRELLDAYLDDAHRCLSSMEQIALTLSPGPQQGTQLRLLCRELHTLKGASASVGFHELARRLHALEDVVESHMSGATMPDRQMLLGEVDAFGQQVRVLTSGASATEMSKATRGASNHVPNLENAVLPKADSTATEETLRVRASQVDRLMDMLAELVMLRNRRDSRVDQIKEVHGRLWQFVSRLRTWPTNCAEFAESNSAAEFLGREANELLEVARILRDLFEPMAEEQRSISRFIGQFRQELTELRRLPIGGLFQRLQRAVHDAAQIDGKRVRLRFEGEQTGLERSLQERLYEPLLHIVRNAVSHGIENEADRMAVGKDPAGTITLQAHGGTNLLAISVRDDGRGLNYDALRRRGTELGLIDSDRPVSRDELSQLIFRPGFSTQSTTTQNAGRGVGMDVVAATLERMHGWVELESIPGQGTHFRLVIPRRSVIEHAMVFRVQNQLLALPMQSVHEIKTSENQADDDVGTTRPNRQPIHFSQLLSGAAHPGSSKRILVLASSGERWHSRDAGRRIALAVDDIIGPQEVVVRPLPQLLSGHPLLSGISLSATGEIVLLLHSQRLFELALVQDRASRAPIDLDHGSQGQGSLQVRRPRGEQVP